MMITSHIIQGIQVVGVSLALEANPTTHGQTTGVGLDLHVSLTLHICLVIIRPPLQEIRIDLIPPIVMLTLVLVSVRLTSWRGCCKNCDC